MFRVKTLRGLSLVALASFGCAPAERGETGEIEAAGSVDAFAMQVGDCFDDQSGQPGEVSDVPGVPCEEPHDNQVFGSVVSLEDLVGNPDDRALHLVGVEDPGLLLEFHRPVP